MISLGLDIGSRNTKLVIFDHAVQTIIYSSWQATDISPLVSVSDLLDRAFSHTGLSLADLTCSAATGYGRKLWNQAQKVLSEISCHAAGLFYHFPEVRTVIDVGGQDSKMICMSDSGKVLDFSMNDKCAAGTGRFLEMTAIRLGVSVDQLAGLASGATQALKLNSTCVVFAESEIIGMMAAHQSAADIARAVHISVAKRIFGQLAALDHHPPYAFTGGVAQNEDMTNCLQIELQSRLLIPPDPEITGALGAAILAVK
jgi:predicted CoA-substrate-specific enzyme activase